MPKIYGLNWKKTINNHFAILLSLHFCVDTRYLFHQHGFALDPINGVMKRLRCAHVRLCKTLGNQNNSSFKLQTYTPIFIWRP